MFSRIFKLNRFSFLAIFFILFGFCLFLTQDFVLADNTDDQKDDLQDDLKKNQEEQEQYKKLIELKQKEQSVIGYQINNIIKENEKIEQDIEDNKQRIDSIQSDIERIDKTIKQKAAHIEVQKELLSKILRDYYQDYSKTSDFFSMIKNDNDSLFSSNNNMSQAMSKVNDLIESIKKEQQDLTEEKEKLQSKNNEVQDAKNELERRNQYLENAKSQKQNLIAQAISEKSQYQKKLSKLEEEQLSIQKEIDSLGYESTGSYSLSDLPQKSKAGFSRPVLNPYVITQGYGKTNFSYNYAGGLHNGIDFVAKGNKSILSAGDGKVLAVGNMGRYGYGNWVAVDHENGLVTLYGHMSSVNVKKGQSVDRGDKIGVMGSTGFSTGTHLHFSIFAKKTFSVVKSSSVSNIYIPTGASVNPNKYL